MRGTRSVGFTIEATWLAGSSRARRPSPTSPARRCCPVSHVLWTSLWLGLASDAVARARAFVRGEARRTPGTVPPVALRLAEAVAELGTMRATVHAGWRRLRDGIRTTQKRSASVGFRPPDEQPEGVRVADGARDRRARAERLRHRGYRNDSPYAVGRHLRDAHGAALMITTIGCMPPTRRCCWCTRKTEDAVHPAGRRGRRRHPRDALLARRSPHFRRACPASTAGALRSNDTLQRIDGLIGRMRSPRRIVAEVVRFPPVLNRRHLRAERLPRRRSRTWPDRFTASTGTERAVTATASSRRRSGSDWSAAFAATDVVLTPAACYPVYPDCSRAGSPSGGRLFDVMSYCFRHEPSERSRAHADVPHARVRPRWAIPRRSWRGARPGSRVARARSLRSSSTRARMSRADPFFGRAAKLLAVNQRDQRLQARDRGADRLGRLPTAIISLQLPSGPLRRAFGISTADGERGAHRVRRVRARADHAGAVPAARSRSRAWPAAVREALGLVTGRALAARSAPRTRGMRCTGRPRLARVQLLRRSLDRAAAHARARAAGRAAVHARRRLRGRPVDVLQVPPRRPRRALRHRRRRAERLAAARRSHRGAARPRTARASSRSTRSTCPTPRATLPARARQDDRSAIQAHRSPGERLGYFHNAGLLTSSQGATSRALSARRLGRSRPAAAVRRDREARSRAAAAQRERAARRLARAARARTSRGGRATTRSAGSRARFADDLEWLAGEPLADFHRYAFATLRQCGAAFELGGAYLRWLEANGEHRARARRGGLRLDRHHGEDAAVQDGARVVSTGSAVRLRRRCSTTMAHAWDGA